MPLPGTQIREEIRRHAATLGAFRTGFAEAAAVDAVAADRYRQWIAMGHNGTMEYCRRHIEVRDDPRLLLDGAQSVIVCAFSYKQPQSPAPLARDIATYAYGPDYHRVVRQRLMALGEFITTRYGGCVRPLVDTAPIRERYWAARAGIGFAGINNQLIIPGAGSYFFLGELLWTGQLPPDPPCLDSCIGCGACVAACPGHALDGHGGCDARRCVSYLTIEYRGELPPDARLGHWIYGCDTCQQVCPHNNGIGAPNTLFPATAPVADLSVDALREMSASHFRRITADSAMQRVTLAQLLRNIERNF